MTERNHDPVLLELDNEIARLESDLQTVRAMRTWWAARQTATERPAKQPSSDSPPQPRLPVNIGPKKSTVEWVRSILSDGARRTAPMIREEAERGGWATSSPQPTTIIRNALKELVRREEVVKSGAEYYVPRLLGARLVSATLTAPATAGAPNG